MLDIDAHHGNGTQAIFYDDPGCSPAPSTWTPARAGSRTTSASRTRPPAPTATCRLPPGTGDEEWLAAVAELVGWARATDADAAVVALGVDAAGGDPESPLEVTADGFRAAGRMLGAMGLPTVVVQEGGYDLDRIGGLVLEVLAGIEEGAHG